MTTCVRCITVFLFLPIVSFSQLLTGELRDTSGEKLDGASVVVLKLDGNPQSYGVVAHQGEFEVKLDNAGSYRVTVSHVGYQTYTEVIKIDTIHSLSIILEPDIMGLNEIVVTGTFVPTINLESSIAISTLSVIQMGRNRRGIASLLQEEPGIYADASAGEVFTRVYARGISISAEDDLGWYYVSLQEDGLPVTAVQFASFAPDFFYRPDNTVDHIEVLRGGSSSISAGNSPGGIINAVSKTNNEYWSGNIEQSFGWHANGNSILRSDIFVSGPLNKKWSFGIGGHFRDDEGARDNDYKKFSQGGQIKFSLKKKIKRGEMIFHLKYLNDHVNRWTGVTAENWADPTAAYDQNLKYTAQLLPALETKIPDGQGGSYEFNPSNGINTIDRTAGFIFNQKIGRWKLKNNFKASIKSANWQTSLSNAKVDLNSPLPYFISGADFPVGQVAFYDAKSNAELARVDNTGVLNGSNPSFTYLSGSLPYDAILGISAWYKDDRNTEFIDQFSLSRQVKNHQINSGVFVARSNVSTLTRASFGYATYEARPRMMKVALENPGQESLYLSDNTGISNYGGLFLEKGDAAVNQLHWFLSDKIDISNSMSVDVGVRIESQYVKGSKYNPASSSVTGGVDNNPLTAYDQSILVPSEMIDDFNYNYNTISFSSGAIYTLSSDITFFGRISKGTKTPELDYYFSNYPGVQIPERGPIQKIVQIESGAKISKRNFSLIPVLFWSRLGNVGSSNFVFDQGSASLFYTPLQLNETRTIGLELQSKYRFTDNLSIKLNGTFQNHKSQNFKVYDAKGSITTDDDEIVHYDGNQLPFNPNVILHITPQYQTKKFLVYSTYSYMGARYGNIANAVKLPAFGKVDAGFTWFLNDQFSASINVNNLFNSNGIMNFYGPNFLGASKDDATDQYLKANPDASFVVVPILPRVISLSLSLAF